MNKELLYKYFRGETSKEEELLIISWVEESEENRLEFLKERKLWDILLVSEHKVDENKKVNHKRIALFSRNSYKYAAVILGAAFIATSLLFNSYDEKLLSVADISEPVLLVDRTEKINLNERSFDLENNDVNIKNDNNNNQLSLKTHKGSKKTQRLNNRLLVPHGQTYTIVLSDSTKVTLNAESELIFPISFGDVREVKLKGEAYFQVAHNDKKPFVVHTDDIDIRVLGTKFNVSNYANENIINTTLVEGSVQMEYKEVVTKLIPSEQFSFNKTDMSSEVNVVDTDVFTSWVNDEYIFRNSTLEEIISKLGRWYKFKVNYEDNSLKCKRFSFTIGRDASLERIMRFIESTKVVDIEIINDSINIKNTMI